MSSSGGGASPGRSGEVRTGERSLFTCTSLTIRTTKIGIWISDQCDSFGASLGLPNRPVRRLVSLLRLDHLSMRFHAPVYSTVMSVYTWWPEGGKLHDTEHSHRAG